MDAKGGRWRKVWVRLFQALLTVVLLVAVAEGVVLLLASRKEKQILSRWSAAGGETLEESFAALPRNGTNESARAVEELAAAMGLIKKDSGGNANYPALPSALLDYHAAQMESPSGVVEAPPEEAAAALAERAASLEALRQALAAGPAPVWESAPDKLYAAPIPPFLLHVNLARLLSADALAALAAGDPGRAMADAEAGWRLTEPLNARPELISKFVSMATTRMWLAVLRKTPAVPEPWADRLGAMDARGDFLKSLRTEVMLGFYLARRGEVDLTEVGVLQSGFSDPLTVPFTRLLLYDAAARNLDLVETIDRQEACSGPYDGVMKAHEESIPSWSLIARIATPNLSDGWARTERFRLDVELTQKVLQIKTARGADGAWPEPPAGFEKSFCPKARWVMAREGEVQALSLEGGPEFTQKAPWTKVPLRYEEAVPAPPAKK